MLSSYLSIKTGEDQILGGVGSGGVVVTDDDAVHARLSRLRYYGRERSPYPSEGEGDDGALRMHATVEVGYNERLDTIDAAVLLVRLRRLRDDLEVRRRHRDRYAGRFQGTAVRVQQATPGSEPSWRVVVVRVPDRDRVYAVLRRSGIEVSLPYLPANHLDGSTRNLGYRRGDLPVTEAVCDSLLALPSHPFLSEDQVDEVAEAVLAAVGRGAVAVEDPGPR